MWVLQSISVPTSPTIPTGAIFTFPLRTVPSDYLICEGQAVSRTTYAALYAFLGDVYGDGDGTTTFNLPDYRGLFLRGQANGETTNDPDYASRTDRGDTTTGDSPGTKQSDRTARPNNSFITDEDTHNHSYFGNHDDQATVQSGSGAGVADDEAHAYTTGNDTHSHTVASGGDNQTAPVNIYVVYAIKI